MAKAYQFAGYFLIGASVVGLLSYTAYAFPPMQAYAFWISVVASLLLIVAGLADEFLSEAMGLTYQQYIGGMISAIAVIIIGSIIQWVR